MSDTTNSLVRHLDPSTDNFKMAGIALIAEDHDPKEIMEFYHKVGRMPDIHPAILYEVKRRGTEGDKLNRTFISLDGDRVLDLGTHFFYVWHRQERSDPRPEDIESAMKTLRQIGLLGYRATAPAGNGTNVTRPVDITGQIEYLLGFHLASPVNTTTIQES